MRLVPDMFDSFESSPQGELAQLVERCDRTAEVRGSNPLFSTAVFHTCWRSRRPLVLTGVSTLVLISVLVRPVALITYALLAFAAGISQADQSRS